MPPLRNPPTIGHDSEALPPRFRDLSAGAVALRRSRLYLLFTGLTAAAWNFGSMLCIRFLFGAGEAGAFPGMARAIFAWLPMKERGVATGVNFAGGRLGAAFALPAVAAMIEWLGWKQSFGVLMLTGFFWAAVWFWWFRDDPATHRHLNVAERDYILSHRQPAAASADKLPIGVILRSGNLWLAMVQYFCSNFTFFFCLSWLFPHLKVVSLSMDTAAGAVLWLSVAIFGTDMTLPPSWAFSTDIGRKDSGAVSGTMNMAGNLGSFVTSLAFPYLLSWTGTPTLFFCMAAGLNLLAMALWAFVRPEQPLESPPT
jgi:ACS family glucarate transporter-like MFS transporter